jgi:hypothetical protein
MDKNEKWRGLIEKKSGFKGFGKKVFWGAEKTPPPPLYISVSSIYLVIFLSDKIAPFAHMLTNLKLKY